MRVFRVRIGIGIASLLLVFLSASLSTSNTYAGLFPAEDGDMPAITDLRVVYTIDRATDTVRVVISQDYDARVDRFVWLYPIPTVEAKIEIDSDFNLVELGGTFKEISLMPPPHYCSDIYEGINQGSGGGSLPASYPESDNYTILTGDNMLNWMASREYRITASQKTKLERYIADGFYFAALEFSSDDGQGVWGRIPTIAITYTSDKVMLPLELSVFQDPAWDWVSLPYSAQIEITLLSDVRYMPENYAEVEVDLTQLRGTHTIARSSTAISDEERDIYGGYGYPSLVSAAIMAHDGRAFDTRYAGYTKDGTYVTQVYGEFGSSSDLEDVVFVPAPDAPPESNEIFLNATRELVDPLEYWGCTTRTLNPAYFEENITPFMESMTTDFETDTSGPNLGRLIYPQDWVRSEVRFNEYSMTVYAPETVDVSDVSAYFAGEPTPPMFIIYWTGIDDNRSIFWYPTSETITTEPRHYRYYTQPHSYGDGRTFAILTSEDDYAAHEAMYRAMVDFPFTYQYMIHPELRHTLLFQYQLEHHQPPLDIDVAIAYPEGWDEAYEDGTLYVFPENADVQHLEMSPVVKLYPAQAIAPMQNVVARWWDDEGKTAVMDWLENGFDIDRETLEAGYQFWPTCAQEPLLPFNKDGRTGMIRYLYPRETPYILEFSAPEADYEQYRDLLDLMAMASITLWGCG